MNTVMKPMWHSGPPPHVGWWNTTTGYYGHGLLWRWWDGKQWSIAFECSAWQDEWVVCPACAELQWLVRWSDYYPENARVPRVDPSVPAQEPNAERVREAARHVRRALELLEG